MKKERIPKKNAGPSSLFTPSISKILDEREAELDRGKFVEVKDLDRLKKENKKNGSKAC